MTITHARKTDNDQALINACAAFESLEFQARDMGPEGEAPVTDEAERARLLACLREKQDELLDVICDFEAATPAGIAARARAITAHKPDLFEDADIGDMCRNLIAALLRDVLAQDLETRQNSETRQDGQTRNNSAQSADAPDARAPAPGVPASGVQASGVQAPGVQAPGAPEAAHNAPLAQDNGALRAA